MLYLGSDHGGFALKQQINAFLAKKKIRFEDLGTETEDSVDYPDYAQAVARKVAAKPAENRGILVCGTGIGMSIAANKVPGVRAAMIYDDFSAKMSREHNDSNVACFGGRTQKPADVTRWLAIWLGTPFAGERHQRRVKKIAKIEEKNRC